MRRITGLHAAEAKTDAQDAAIIAQAARTLPHALRSIQLADEQVAELSMHCGFDNDLVGQATATSNRIRGPLTQIHPALERIFGAYLDHAAVPDVLQHYPSPAAMTAAGTTRLGNRLVKLAPRMGRRLAEEITQALAEQTVVVIGTNAASMVLPRLTQQIAALRRQRAEIAVKVERLVDAHPIQPVLTSMPGVSVRTAARLLTEIFGKDFATAGHQTLRVLHSGRASIMAWEQDPETGAVSLRVRSPTQSRLTGLLRPQERPGQTPQPSPHRPRPAPLRRSLRMLRDGTLYQTEHQLAASQNT